MKRNPSLRYLLLSSLLSLVGFLAIPNLVYAASAIKGNIDKIAKVGGSYYARGWACQTGYTTSIEVRLLAGGRAGTGTLFTRGIASNSSASGVANACGSTGKNYRFNMLIPTSAIAAHGGKKLFIHGISPIGSGNSLINKSGTYALPKSIVKGYIDKVAKVNNSYYAKGWACQTGYSTSISVHLYAGGAAGKGAYFTGGTAIQSSETAVATACSSTGKKYRFNILIPTSAIAAHGGKSLYVHGISSIGTSNLVINRSGVHSLPAAPSTGRRVVFIHTDLLGSPAAETDEQGEVQ